MSARRRRIIGALLWQCVLLVSILSGALVAFAQDDGGKKPKTAASSSVTGSVSSSGSATPVTLGVMPTPLYTTGLSPVAAGSSVPKAWLPPGADDPDPGPSAVIFPNQRITLRFNHKKHVQEQNLKCTYCHSLALKSTLAVDFLVPTKHDKCSSSKCHAIDDAEPLKEATPGARCDFCHVGANIDAAAKTATIAPLRIPTPNLKMNHKAHLDREIKCEQCHGEVSNLELATRDQMPRMKGCFGCHQSGDAGGLSASTKGAKSECTTCHVTDASNVTLKTMYSTGFLMPPKWLKNARHGPDWIERHKKVAGVESTFCANCHKEQECTDCHDGKVKPQSIHPNDFLNMHEVAARFDQPKCVTCHSTTNFCLPCHTRAGVANSAPGGVATSARFHPPPEVWSGAIRKAGHHSFEAQKNINACVSCHVERDCVVCHGTQGVGGSGANPHPVKFLSKCSTMYLKNPRPCFVCHDPYDKNLDSCR